MQVNRNLKKGLTAVIITNRRISEIKALEKVRSFVDKTVIVTSLAEDTIDLEGVKVVHSNSRNFAYLRNLGAFYAETTHIITIDSDEDPDEILIEEIKQCDLDNSLYNFEVSSYFNQSKMNITTHLSNKIYDRTKFIFTGSVHERLYGDRKNPITLKGTLSNYSQANWDEWYQKAKRFTSLEVKNLNVLLRALYPIYIYFSKEGWKDGFLGLRYTIKGVEYVFLILVRGRMNYITLSIDQINSKIKEGRINNLEREFIRWIVQHYFSNDKCDSRLLNAFPYIDLLEQISSPFIANP